MTKVRSVTQRILVWSYERGTLQYDIICALILAFVFFVPPSCFVGKKIETDRPAIQNSTGPEPKAGVDHPANHAHEYK